MSFDCFDKHCRISGNLTFSRLYRIGKGSIADNALVASQKGLEILAITDHGARQPIIGVAPKKFDAIRKDLQEVQSHYPNLKLLMGIEANIMGVDGDIDFSGLIQIVLQSRIS